MTDPELRLEALKELAEDPSVIVVDLYALADRQMLYLDVQSPEALGQLRSVFVELAEGRARGISLSSVGWAALSRRISDVTLKLTDARYEPSRTVRIRKGRPGAPSVEWTRHSEGWLECAELLDGLTGMGHQYMNCGLMDDAGIEVSFGEAGPAHRLRHLSE